MNIIIIDNSIDSTGASNAILKNALELKDKFKFLFIVPKNSKTKYILETHGFICYEFGFIEISRNIFSNIAYLFVLIFNSIKLIFIIRRENIEIVHVNDLFNMVGVVSKLFCNFKLITHIRRMPESFPLGLYRIWNKIHLMASDLILPVSYANAKVFGSSLKVVVLYDTLPMKEVYGPYKVWNNKPAFEILYMANYIRGKGHEYALEAFNTIHARFPYVKLNFYGGDFGLKKNKEFKDLLISRAKEKKIDAFVSFNGKVNDVEYVMKKHDLILNFSDSESFSRYTLESLFYGIPIIATNVGGTLEMFPVNFHNLIVPRANIDEMVNAISLVILDNGLRERFKEVKNYVREKFSCKNTSFKLAELYKSLLLNKNQ